MAEQKGCGCGKKNVAPAPPPEQQTEQAPAEQPAFRSGEIIENGVKKN
jgi:hypothetical protein